MEHSETSEPKIDPSLYLNRWIAVVRGRVIGVGTSRGQAYRAAMKVRGKDKPSLYFVDQAGRISRIAATATLQLDRHPLLQTIIEIFQTHQIRAYLVGGAVRDILLERETIIDLDFAVPQKGLVVARLVADSLEAAYYPLDVKRGTGRVVYELPAPVGAKKHHLDFATFRGPTLIDDLVDRDFTINAMAIRLSDPPELIDPLGGQGDLAQGRIRATSETAVPNDPIRVLRAVRQAAEFDFQIEANTERYLTQAAPTLAQVSPERQRDELLKLLNSPAPGQAMQLLRQLSVLPHVLPEIEALAGVIQSPPHHLDVFEHTIAALSIWSRRQTEIIEAFPLHLQPEIKRYLAAPMAGDLTIGRLLPLALLLHDAGKPATRSEEAVDEAGQNVIKIRFLGHESEGATLAAAVLNRLHFSSQAVRFVKTVVANHMRPLSLANSGGRLTRRAMYRFFRDTATKGGNAGVAVALHAIVDGEATYPPDQGQADKAKLLAVATRLLTTFFEKRAEVVEPSPLLTGRDLIKILNLTEGRLIGILLKRLKEAQATGHVNERDEALAWLKADPDFIRYQEQGKRDQ